MEQRKRRTKLCLLLMLGLPCLLLFVFYFMPWEKGETEGAIFRNAVRQQRALPSSVTLCAIEDVSYEGEDWRFVVYSYDEKFYLHRYVKKEDGAYGLSSDAGFGNGTAGRRDDVGSVMLPDVYTFIPQYIGYNQCNIYYNNNESLEKIVLDYTLREHWADGRAEEIHGEKTIMDTAGKKLLFVPSILKEIKSNAPGRSVEVSLRGYGKNGEQI